MKTFGSELVSYLITACKILMVNEKTMVSCHREAEKLNMLLELKRGEKEVHKNP